MKTPKLFVFAIAIATMGFSQPDAGLTDSERKYALNLLQETKENLLKKVKGLTQEQLNFKVNAESWSITECVEHVAIAENNFSGLIQTSLKEAADPSKRNEVKMTDDALVKMITDRTHKLKTTEAFQPSGKFGSFDRTLNEFKTKRANNIDYIKTTPDDLRNHYNDFPFGKIDTYQTILFMAAHTKRHTEQVEEVMSAANFPKKK
jgi:hypothetical protein